VPRPGLVFPLPEIFLKRSFLLIVPYKGYHHLNLAQRFANRLLLYFILSNIPDGFHSLFLLLLFHSLPPFFYSPRLIQPSSSFFSLGKSLLF
jgi:hypothetical protein